MGFHTFRFKQHVKVNFPSDDPFNMEVRVGLIQCTTLKRCFLISKFIRICCLHSPCKTWRNETSNIKLLVLQTKNPFALCLKCSLRIKKEGCWLDCLRKIKGRWNIKRNRRKEQEYTHFHNEGVCTLTAPRYWGYGAVLVLSHQGAVFCSLHRWTAVCHAAFFSTEFLEESYSTHRFLLKQTQSSITSCELWVRHTHQSGAERVKVVCIADGRCNTANSSGVWTQSANWGIEQTCFEMNGLWTTLVSIVTQCVFIGPASNNTAKKKQLVLTAKTLLNTYFQLFLHHLSL